MEVERRGRADLIVEVSHYCLSFVLFFFFFFLPWISCCLGSASEHEIHPLHLSFFLFAFWSLVTSWPSPLLFLLLGGHSAGVFWEKIFSFLRKRNGRDGAESYGRRYYVYRYYCQKFECNNSFVHQVCYVVVVP